VLEREGYVVDHVAGLADLREAARLANSDVVLLDRALPDGDGVEAIPELRQCIPGIPVIVITARAEVEDRVSGLDLGADDYLAKPFAMEELLAR
ncbi:response regulator transcription factor, partial [Escherichia coli]|nr:response regulator transcription factor [Escherichia coli]